MNEKKYFSEEEKQFFFENYIPVDTNNRADNFDGK